MSTSNFELGDGDQNKEIGLEDQGGQVLEVVVGEVDQPKSLKGEQVTKQFITYNLLGSSTIIRGNFPIKQLSAVLHSKVF